MTFMCNSPTAELFCKTQAFGERNGKLEMEIVWSRELENAKEAAFAGETKPNKAT